MSLSPNLSVGDTENGRLIVNVVNVAKGSIAAPNADEWASTQDIANWSPGTGLIPWYTRTFGEATIPASSAEEVILSPLPGNGGTFSILLRSLTRALVVEGQIELQDGVAWHLGLHSTSRHSAPTQTSNGQVSMGMVDGQAGFIVRSSGNTLAVQWANATRAEAFDVKWVMDTVV